MILVIAYAKYFLRFFFYSNLYYCFLVSIHFCLICKLVLIASITKSLFTFFSVLQKKFITWLTKTKWQNREIVLWFVQNPFGESEALLSFSRSGSLCFCYNFYFYIFKNLIDIIIFIDILLSLIFIVII